MILRPVESLLNRSIANAASAQALCRKLKDRTLALHVQGPEVAFCLRSDGEQLHLTLQSNNQQSAIPDASISGTPLALLGLLAKSPEAQLRSGVVRIEGDAEAAQGFQNLLKAARPDLEEELSRFVGDVAAYRLGSLARGVLAAGKRAAGTFGQNVSEYLQEESRDVPPRLELDEFAQGVDRLRDDVDRADARLTLLERRRS